MTEQIPTPPGPTAPRYDVRNLRRSTDDRMIGGVCGGLGRYSGIDPIIFRIALAALAVFGGIGLLLYALAWLLVPEDGTNTSEAQRLLQGHPAPMTIVTAIVVGVLGVFALVDIAHHGGGARIPFLIILAIVAAIIIGRRPHRAGLAGATTPQPTYAPPPPAQSQYAAPQYTAPQYVAPRYQPPLYSPPRRAEARYQPPSDFVPPPKRTPSMLAPLALSAGAVIIGILFVLDASHAIELSAQTIFATALLTIGLALVIGAWIGRARSLIFVGLVLTVALAVAAAIDVPLRGGIGNRTAAPTSASAFPATYRLGVGKQVIDLTGFNPAGHTVAVKAVVGVGQLRVMVPDNVKVVVRGRAGTGNIEIAGDETGGTRVDRTEVIDPTRTPSTGELDLDLRVGVGGLEVDQVLQPTGANP